MNKTPDEFDIVLIGDGLTGRAFQSSFDAHGLAVVALPPQGAPSPKSLMTAADRALARFYPYMPRSERLLTAAGYATAPADVEEWTGHGGGSSESLAWLKSLRELQILQAYGGDCDWRSWPLGPHVNSLLLQGPHGQSVAWGGTLAIPSGACSMELPKALSHLTGNFELRQATAGILGAVRLDGMRAEIPEAQGIAQSFALEGLRIPALNLESSISARSSVEGSLGRGVCLNHGVCPTCPTHAVTRPWNIAAEHSVHRVTATVESLSQHSDGGWLLHLNMTDEGRVIRAREVVVASGCLSPLPLLQRSGLIAAGSRPIGDHAPLEIEVGVPDEWLQEGEWNGLAPSSFIDLEVPSLASASQERTWNCHLSGLRPRSKGTSLLYCELEILPTDGFRVSSWASASGARYASSIAHEDWERLVRRLDQVTAEIVAGARELGLEVRDIKPHYRSGLGGHHLTSALAEDLDLNGWAPTLPLSPGLFVIGPSTHPRPYNAGPVFLSVLQGADLGMRLSSGLRDADAH